MSIERLSALDEVTTATSFAVNLNGQDYRVTGAELLAFLTAAIVVPGAMVTQYAAPSATGFSVTIAPPEAGESVWLLLTPVAGYAAGTIVLPAAADVVDGQELVVNSTQAVTTLTVNGNGNAVTGAPTTLAANAFFRLRFDAVLNSWYRIG